MSLQIIDINGRVVATLVNGIPNSNKVVWNGKNDGGQPMPAGIYFARMESGKRVLTQKMVLLK
jgi:flagellar hook assembly protein FlgD